MSIKLTEADIGRKVKTVSDNIGIVEKNASGINFPFKVKFEKSMVYTYTTDGTVYRRGEHDYDLVAFVDENPATMDESIPPSRLKVGDIVTFLNPDESCITIRKGSSGYYHGGASVKGTVGKITSVQKYNDFAGCFDVSVEFKHPSNNATCDYLMLEKEFEEYHKPRGESHSIMMFEEAGKFPNFSPSPKSDITVGTKIVPIACTNMHNYKLNKVYEVVRMTPISDAFVCKDSDGKEGNAIRPKDFRIVGIIPEVGDIIEAVANDNDHNYAFGKHYVVCAMNDRSVRAIDENAKLGNYLRFSNLHIVKKASKSTGEILVKGIKVEQPKTQKTQNSISHEIYRLPEAIIRREDLQGTAAVGKTTRIAIELGHLSHRVCSGE
jgi:hypothetical protein